MKKTILILVVSLFLGSMMMTATNENVIWGNYVTYKSSTEVYITAGSGRCNGTVWEHATETTLDLTSVLPAGEDFVYIYVDDSASSYPTPTFIGSTTEPAWSSTLIGWYNGDDRCIGVVWVNSSGNIATFNNTSNHEYYVNSGIKQVLSNQNPTGSWTFVETTDYTPVNANGVLVKADNGDSAYVYIAVGCYDNTQSNIQQYGYGGSIALTGWIHFHRSSGRDLQWVGQNDDDNNFNLHIRGFRIER